MDLDALLKADAAAREFEHKIERRTFRLRTPTEFEFRDLYSRASAGGHINLPRAIRWTVEAACIGWSGVTVGDLLPRLPDDEAKKDAVPFSAQALELLVENRLDWADELVAELQRRRAARTKETRAAAKNS